MRPPHVRRSNTSRNLSTSKIAKKKRTKNFQIGNKLFKVYLSTLREMKMLQQNTRLSILKRPFSRFVREVMQDYNSDLKVTSEALEALHEATEAFVINVFEYSNMCSCHAKRITLKPDDVRLVREIMRGCGVPCT